MHVTLDVPEGEGVLVEVVLLGGHPGPLGVHSQLRCQLPLAHYHHIAPDLASLLLPRALIFLCERVNVPIRRTLAALCWWQAHLACCCSIASIRGVGITNHSTAFTRDSLWVCR